MDPNGQQYTPEHLPLLALLTEQGRGRFLAESARCEVRAGEVVCREGDPGSEVYVVLAGRFRVVAQGLEGEREIGKLGAGDLFGEMALLTNQKRNATVVAVEDAVLLRLGNALMRELLATNPRMREALGHLAIQRAESLMRGLAA